MGARQSKRSVDITTTPKKGEEAVVGEGEGKVEKIAEVDAKITTNGTLHAEIEFADKDESAKEETEKSEIKENGVSESEDSKTPDAELSPGDQKEQQPAAECTSPSSGEKPSENGEKIEETPETKKNKEKSKKKKWSFRSISFSKKDKSKPSKDAEKNGEVKEVAEEVIGEAEVKSPTTEEAAASAPKVEEKVEKENGDAPAAPVTTNGDATAEELKSKAEEPAKIEEEPVVAKPIEVETPALAEEPKVVSPPSPIAESVPSPIKEEIKPPVEEPAPKSEEPLVIEKAPEETKEVRSTEETPPPLPSSNPPSPVTVFAESTKADPVILAAESSVPVPETLSESEPLQASSLPVAADESSDAIEAPPKEIESQPVAESDVNSSKTESMQNVPSDGDLLPSPAHDDVVVVESKESEPPVNVVSDDNNSEVVNQAESVSSEPIVASVAAADSLPDISTESLPSLPEPVSDSLPEPMSLPPVDSLPEPISVDNNTTNNELPPAPPSPVSDIPLPPPTETILTNGNTNGLPSPVNNDDTIPPIEGQLKQVPKESNETKCDVNTPEVPAAETTTEAAAVEE